MSTLLTVGVPKEIKPMEARIALVPHAVADLVRQSGLALLWNEQWLVKLLRWRSQTMGT